MHCNRRQLSGSRQTALMSMCPPDSRSDAMKHTPQGELGGCPEPEGTVDELHPGRGPVGQQLRTDLAHHQDSGPAGPPEPAHLQEKHRGNMEGGVTRLPKGARGSPEGTQSPCTGVIQSPPRAGTGQSLVCSKGNGVHLSLLTRAPLPASWPWHPEGPARPHGPPHSYHCSRGRGFVGTRRRALLGVRGQA